MNKRQLKILIFYIVIFGTIAWLNFYYFIGAVLLLSFHEFGHFIVAKCFGEFDSFLIHNLNPAVRLKREAKERYKHNLVDISGFLFSLLTLPIMYFLKKDILLLLFLVCIGGSLGDFKYIIQRMKEDGE